MNTPFAWSFYLLLQPTAIVPEISMTEQDFVHLKQTQHTSKSFLLQ